MAAVRHLGFVGRVLGPPTRTTRWSLCVINFPTATVSCLCKYSKDKTGNLWLSYWCCCHIYFSKKGNVFPYSLPSVGPGADPGVQAVSPQVTWSESRHIPGSRLTLLSARPAVTSVAFIRWRYLKTAAHVWFQPLLIYRSRKDEWLSWPSWLTYSRLIADHISGHPSAAGRAQDRELRRLQYRLITCPPVVCPRDIQ